MPAQLRSATLIALVAGAIAPAAVHAAAWTRPAVLQPSCGKPAFNCVVEPAPRAAVNAHGQTLVAWIDSRTRVRAAVADAGGRFGHAATLGKGLRPGVAITAGGTQTVVWTGGHSLRFARRTPGHGFSAPRQLTPTHREIGDDDAKVAGQPDGGTLVVYENSYRDAKGRFQTRIRSVTISPAGLPGPIEQLGYGFIDHDSFRAAAGGQAAVCCLASPVQQAPSGLQRRNTTVAGFTPGKGWTTKVPALGPNERVETVAAGSAAVALGTIDVVRSGDAGSLGVPGLLRLDAPGPAHIAPVVRATRAFGPVVAIDGAGRDVLVYQEKDQSAAFSRTAPIYAVVGAPQDAFGARQLLDAGRAFLPLVRAFGRGAIAAWETPTNRWRVSIERGGRFTAVAAPIGPGPSLTGQDFNYSRDIAVRGRYAVLAWTAIDGTIRASIGTP